MPMEKDLELINDHLKDIRNKIKIVQEQNNNLKEFNYKMSSLLESLDCYSISSKGNVERKSKIPVLKVKEKVSKAEDIKKEILKTNVKNRNSSLSPVLLEHNANTEGQNGPLFKSNEVLFNDSIHMIEMNVPDTSNLNLTFTSLNNRDDIFNDLLNKAFSNEGASKLNRTNIIKVLELLYKNKNGMLLDDVLKTSGISKYKCTDVLNFLIRIDPPIVTKKFDKGFVYCIRKQV